MQERDRHYHNWPILPGSDHIDSEDDHHEHEDIDSNRDGHKDFKLYDDIELDRNSHSHSNGHQDLQLYDDMYNNIVFDEGIFELHQCGPVILTLQTDTSTFTDVRNTTITEKTTKVSSVESA